MKRWKDCVLCCVSLLAAAFALYCAILFIQKDAFIFGDTAVYYTKAELTELYQRNRGILHAARDGVVTEQIMARMPTKRNGTDFDQANVELRAQFTEDELERIYNVYRTLHPYTMSFEWEMKSISYAYRIVFGKQRQEAGVLATSLYWFPSEEDRDSFVREGRIDASALTQIDDGWYIVAETKPW